LSKPRFKFEKSRNLAAVPLPAQSLFSKAASNQTTGKASDCQGKRLLAPRKDTLCWSGSAAMAEGRLTVPSNVAKVRDLANFNFG